LQNTDYNLHYIRLLWKHWSLQNHNRNEEKYWRPHYSLEHLEEWFALPMMNTIKRAKTCKTTSYGWHNSVSQMARTMNQAN
jgi:hypothetical protein